MSSVLWLDVELSVIVDDARVASTRHADVELGFEGDDLDKRIGTVKVTGESVEALLDQLSQAVWKTGPSQRVTIAEKALNGMRDGLAERGREIEDLKVVVQQARDALREILAIASDREAFVMQGPRAFARAEQIARAALEATE